MIEDNILAYKIVQSISFNLFIIANEYASKTFKILFFFGDEQLHHGSNNINDLWKIHCHIKPLLVSCLKLLL